MIGVLFLIISSSSFRGSIAACEIKNVIGGKLLNSCSGADLEQCRVECRYSENRIRKADVLLSNTTTCQASGTWDPPLAEVCFDDFEFMPQEFGHNCKGKSVETCNKNVCPTVQSCANRCKNFGDQCAGFTFVFDPAQINAFTGTSCFLKPKGCSYEPVGHGLKLRFFKKERRPTTTSTSTSTTTTPTITSPTTTTPSVSPSTVSLTTTPWYTTTTQTSVLPTTTISGTSNSSTTPDIEGFLPQPKSIGARHHFVVTDKDEFPIYLVIAAAAAAVIFIVILIVAICICVRVRNKRKERKRSSIIDAYYRTPGDGDVEEEAGYIGKDMYPVPSANFDEADPDEYTTSIDAIVVN